MSTKPATLPAPNAAGAMEFTKRFLRAKNPCANGFRWFVRHVEDGASYQEALDTLVQAGRVEDACWLLTQFGPTDAVLTVDAIEAEAILSAPEAAPNLFSSVEEALDDLEPAPIVPPPRRTAESFLDEGNVSFNVGHYGLAIERYGPCLL